MKDVVNAVKVKGTELKLFIMFIKFSSTCFKAKSQDGYHLLMNILLFSAVFITIKFKAIPFLHLILIY